jgi:hypothetical protein
VPLAAAVLARNNVASYRRGRVTEAYRNGPAGLEQTFTLARRPVGGAAGGTRTVTVAVIELTHQSREKGKAPRGRGFLHAPEKTRTSTDHSVHKALNLARLPIPPQARGR